MSSKYRPTHLGEALAAIVHQVRDHVVAAVPRGRLPVIRRRPTDRRPHARRSHRRPRAERGPPDGDDGPAGDHATPTGVAP